MGPAYKKIIHTFFGNLVEYDSKIPHLYMIIILIYNALKYITFKLKGQVSLMATYSQYEKKRTPITINTDRTYGKSALRS
jgi:hypothetical protein